MISRIVTVLIVSLISGTAHSQQSQKRSAADAIFEFALSKPDYSPAGRSQLATMFSAYCQQILNALPTNTPAEQAWVKEEGSTTDIKRITRLTQSTEWARYQLKETYSECLSRVSQLKQAQASQNRRQEAAIFVSAALTFNESADLGRYADRLGMASDEFKLLASIRRVLMIAALRTLDTN